MAQLIMYDKFDENTRQLQEKVGYFPYGVAPNKVMVSVSSHLGDAALWVYLMSIGAAGFFASNYVTMKSKESLEMLVKTVRHYLRKEPLYLLHGTPYYNAKEKTYVQTLLLWDADVHESRCRQLLGTFVADHIADKITFEDKEKTRKEKEKEKEKKVSSWIWRTLPKVDTDSEKVDTSVHNNSTDDAES